MNDLKLRVEEVMVEKIQSVLTGEVEVVELQFVKPNDVIKYVESVGGKFDNDFDSNSGDLKYWLNLEYNGRDFDLVGDGFSSESSKFSLGM